jgi:DNA-binding transcriptional regulator GbsR (MarR family)
MKIEEAKMEFVQSWGSLGSAWGIPRSMAQIHALLLASSHQLSAEDIMESIQLSRGNVNINLRELMNWKLINKQSKIGERKEFFAANHDIWLMAKNIVQERKRRELQPVQDLLIKLKSAKLEGDVQEIAHFQKVISDLEEFVAQMNQLSELMIKLNDNAFFKKMIKMLG